MKVIDLLNKIANDEEVPNHIRYEGIDLYYNKKNNCYDLIMSNVREEFYTFSYSDLNNEIEIIKDTPKEDKKIEKLDLTFEDKFIKENFNSGGISYLDTYATLKMIYNKQSEIIDKIN